MTSPAQTQTTTAFNQMSSYFSDLANYLSGQSSTYPTASTYMSNLDYSELFTIAGQTQRGSPNFANGALIETIHHITAVQRELGLGALTKFEHYQDGQNDGNTESEYYTMLSNQYGYMVSGLGTAATTVSEGVTT
jgi:hypothetical protein